jgi:hypothetical protein
MSDEDLDENKIEPYADVKILGALAVITLAIFALAVIGAVDVFHTMQRWFA